MWTNENRGRLTGADCASCASSARSIAGGPCLLPAGGRAPRSPSPISVRMSASFFLNELISGERSIELLAVQRAKRGLDEPCPQRPWRKLGPFLLQANTIRGDHNRPSGGGPCRTSFIKRLRISVDSHIKGRGLEAPEFICPPSRPHMP